MLETKYGKLAYALQVLIVLGAFNVVAFNLYILFIKGVSAQMFDIYSDFFSDTVTWNFSFFAQCLFAGIAAVQVVIMLLVLLNVFRFLGFVRRDNVMFSGALKAVKNCGGAILVFAIIGLISTMVYTVALTLNAPEGMRRLSVSIDTGDLWLFVAGGVMILMGGALQSAMDAVEENKSFV